jgi:hypothetical protein
MTPMPTDSIAAGRPVPDWLKGGLLAALVFGACWGGAIWYWRATERMPANGDLALYLLVLPLALVLAPWLGRKLSAQPASAPGTAAQAKPTQTAAAPSSAPLAILAASLRSPHGASVEELSAAIADNKARADLDQELVDENGFPVLTARSGDATDEALQEEIMEWLATNGMPELRFSDEQWRALTLASAVAGDLASHAASGLIPPEGTPPMLQLIPILPTEWHIEQRRAAGMWLKHVVSQFGWPPAHISLAPQVPPDAGVTPSAVLVRLAHDGAATNAPLAAIVVSCASNIGEETVAQWAANGSLFTSAQPHGLIPGEGAAGLLLADLRLAQSIDGAAFALLDSVGEARRDSSADEIRRADPKLLGELAAGAIKPGGGVLSEVAMIVADTGHRSNRVLELMGLSSAAMPQLDGTDDVVRVSIASGSCGAVPFMTALALARHHALEREAPVLCVSNEDPYHRCAALVRPAATLSPDVSGNS